MFYWECLTPIWTLRLCSCSDPDSNLSLFNSWINESVDTLDYHLFSISRWENKCFLSKCFQWIQSSFFRFSFIEIFHFYSISDLSFAIFKIHQFQFTKRWQILFILRIKCKYVLCSENIFLSFQNENKLLQVMHRKKNYFSKNG